MKVFLKWTAMFILIVVISASSVVLFNVLTKKQGEAIPTTDPILAKIMNSATETTAYSGKLKLTINGKTINNDIKLETSPSLKFDITTDLSSIGITNNINIKFVNNIAYLTLDNGKFKFDTSKIQNDLPFLKEILNNFAPETTELNDITIVTIADSNENSDAKVDLMSYLGIDLQNFDMSNLDVSALTSVLNDVTTKETKTGYEINLNVKNTISAKAVFNKDCSVDEVNVEDFLINGNTCSMSFIASPTTSFNITKPSGTFTDLTNSIDIVKLVQKQISSNSWYSSISLSTSNTKINGSFYSQNSGSNYKAYLNLIVSNQTLKIQIQNQNWYLTYGKTKVYGSFAEITKLLSGFTQNVTLQKGFNTILNFMNSIKSIQTSNTATNIFTNSGMNISFDSKNGNLTKLKIKDSSLNFTMSFAKYTGSIASVQSSQYSKCNSINALTATSKNGNSFVSAVSDFLFSSSPAVSITFNWNNLKFVGTAYFSFGEVKYSVNGKLTISGTKTQTYDIKLDKASNAVYASFGSLKVYVTSANYNDWLKALNNITGFDFKNLISSLKTSTDILDFAGNITNTPATAIDAIVDIMQKSTTTSSAGVSSVSYKTNAGATAKLSFNTKTEKLSFDIKNLKMNGHTATISAIILSEKEISYSSAKSGYLNISKLGNLLLATNNTLNQTDVKLTGPIFLTLPVIGEIRMQLSIQLKKTSAGYSFVALLDNLPTGIYMDVSGNARHYVYIYGQNGKMYYARYKSTEGKEKIGGSLFNPIYDYYEDIELMASGWFTMADITKSTEKTMKFLSPLLGVRSIVISAINLFSSNKTVDDFNLKLDELLAEKGYTYNTSNSMHRILFDLKSITGNSDYSNLDLRLTTQNNKIKSIYVSISAGTSVKFLGTGFTLYSTLPNGYFNYSNHQQTVNLEHDLNYEMNRLTSGKINRTITNHTTY